MIGVILLRIMLFIIITSAGGLRPFVATGAEGLKQPSKGSPPLNIIMVDYQDYQVSLSHLVSHDDHNNDHHKHEGLKQPSKGSPPLNIIMVKY